MSGKVEIRDKDSVAKHLLPVLEDFYSGLGSDWSRFVPEELQSNGYRANRLTATEGMTGRAQVNVSCYKPLDSSKFFLGVISRSTPEGSVVVEAFLALVPEEGVIDMQYGNHGCPKRRTIMEKRMSPPDDESLSKTVSESLEVANNACEELESKNLQELILET